MASDSRMVIPASNSEAARPHTLFTRPDCAYCGLFIKHIRDTEIERMINVVDVTRNPVDPRQVHSVPTIVVNHSTVYIGRDAFSWLLNELKTAISPTSMRFVHGAQPALLDDTDEDFTGLASVHFTEPEPLLQNQNTQNESVDSRLARMKAERT